MKFYKLLKQLDKKFKNLSAYSFGGMHDTISPYRKDLNLYSIFFLIVKTYAMSIIAIAYFMSGFYSS